MASTTTPNETAIGKSISFRPGSLYQAAAEYGDKQQPKLNPSEVVCLALRRFFAAEGFSFGGEHAELMAKLDAAVKDNPALVPSLERVLKQAARIRNTEV